VATSIQLADHFLAALRASLPYTPEAEDLNLGDIAADAMSIPFDHPMVLRFERHPLHKAANASGKANSGDSPVADRNKRQPKTATSYIEYERCWRCQFNKGSCRRSRFTTECKPPSYDPWKVSVLLVGFQNRALWLPFGK
jgi:hypothetical protein